MVTMGLLTEHFKPTDFACSCGSADCRYKLSAIEGEPHFCLDERIAIALGDIRAEVNIPLLVVSGLRCPLHAEEQKKKRPGAHSAGFAVDIRPANLNVITRGALLKAVFARFGVGQSIKGVGIAKYFTHIDCGHTSAARPDCGVVWTYGGK